MKKIVLSLLFCLLMLTGCNKIEDYSEYLFTSASWVRDSGHDTETLTLYSDGRFSYSCACGNPVNDSDLCENYTYDDKTKEITLKCFEEVSDTIKNIKIVKSTNDTLELDFNGEIRVFSKEE